MPVLRARIPLAAAVILAIGAASAFAAGPPLPGATAKGPVLVDEKGMTLYIFDHDRDGKSACTGKCAENWPPLLADPGAKPHPGYSLVARADGKQQWAHKGHPLYRWIKDQIPGETTGDGVNGSWHTAKP